MMVRLAAGSIRALLVSLPCCALTALGCGGSDGVVSPSGPPSSGGGAVGTGGAVPGAGGTTPGAGGAATGGTALGGAATGGAATGGAATGGAATGGTALGGAATGGAATGGAATGGAATGGAATGGAATGGMATGGAAAHECDADVDCDDGDAQSYDTCTAGVCAHDRTGCGVSPGAERLAVSVEFTTPSYQLLTDNSYTPLVNDGQSTYFVWVDGDFRPRVTRITDGAVETVLLDPNDDYHTRNDGHHMYSLGIDADGYIHIAGDMHHHPASNTDHLPERYRTSRVMYWVSSAPRSIDGFTFQGSDPSRAITGYGFSYGSFNTAPDGTLYYLSRNRVHELGHHPGEMGLGLARYSTVTRSWTALGSLPPSARPAKYPVVVWEDNGHDGTFYQGFRASMRFDHYGRLHLAAVVNDDNGVGAPTHAVYAASDDGGVTFQRADGTPISLPVRVDPGPGQGDVVAGPHTDLDLFASVFFDGNHNPAVVYSRNLDHLTGSYHHYDPATGTWSERLVSPVGGWIREKHHVDRCGVLTFVEQSGKIERTTAFEVEGEAHTLTVDGKGIKLHSIDERGLAERNEWRGVFAYRDSPGLGIVKFSFE